MSRTKPRANSGTQPKVVMVGIMPLSQLWFRRSAEDAESRPGVSRPVLGKMSYQLVERAGPALLVARPRRLGLQTRMRGGELGPGIDRSQLDFDPRFLASFLGIARMGPTPAHDQTGGLVDFDILAAAFMLAAVKHPEPDAEAAAHTDIGFGVQHWS